MGAGQLDLGVGQGGVGAGLLALGLLQGRLVGARVDLEQHLAAVDDLAIGEPDLLHVAGDAWADVDGVGGLEAADVVVPVADLALQRRGDHDIGRRRRRSLLGASCAQPDQRDEKETPAMPSHDTPHPPGRLVASLAVGVKRQDAAIGFQSCNA